MTFALQPLPYCPGDLVYCHANGTWIECVYEGFALGAGHVVRTDETIVIVPQQYRVLPIHLNRAERYVRNGERHVARQRGVIQRMERRRHREESVQLAREVLAQLVWSLALARKWLQQQREMADRAARTPS